MSSSSPSSSLFQFWFSPSLSISLTHSLTHSLFLVPFPSLFLSFLFFLPFSLSLSIYLSLYISIFLMFHLSLLLTFFLCSYRRFTILTGENFRRKYMLGQFNLFLTLIVKFFFAPEVWNTIDWKYINTNAFNEESNKIIIIVTMWSFYSRSVYSRIFRHPNCHG